MNNQLNKVQRLVLSICAMLMCFAHLDASASEAYTLRCQNYKGDGDTQSPSNALFRTDGSSAEFIDRNKKTHKMKFIEKGGVDSNGGNSKPFALIGSVYADGSNYGNSQNIVVAFLVLADNSHVIRHTKRQGGKILGTDLYGACKIER